MSKRSWNGQKSNRGCKRYNWKVRNMEVGRNFLLTSTRSEQYWRGERQECLWIRPARFLDQEVVVWLSSFFSPHFLHCNVHIFLVKDERSPKFGTSDLDDIIWARYIESQHSIALHPIIKIGTYSRLENAYHSTCIIPQQYSFLCIIVYVLWASNAY